MKRRDWKSPLCYEYIGIRSLNMKKEMRMKTAELKTGRSIPMLGLGTWQLTGDTCTSVIKEAVAMGYTHIDTADGYNNHLEVGRGIKESGVPRESLFITTKVAKPKQKKEKVLAFGERMLRELQIDYVDLLLIHWPTRSVPFAETFGALNELVDRGIVRDIGISNFNAELTGEASRLSTAPVVMNQVEFHPLLFQRELLETCESLGIKITAYSPLAQGEVMKNDVIRDIASGKGVSPAQISIAWLIGKGIIAIPKASGAKHLKSNLEAASLELDESEIEAIDSIREQKRIIQADGWREYDF